MDTKEIKIERLKRRLPEIIEHNMREKDKLGTVSSQIICPSDELTYLVTEEIDSDIKNLYQDKNIVVVT